MRPNAKEAEHALNSALQAQAIADLVADIIADRTGLDDYKLHILSYVTAGICTLLNDVIEVLEHVRDDATMEADS